MMEQLAERRMLREGEAIASIEEDSEDEDEDDEDVDEDEEDEEDDSEEEVNITLISTCFLLIYVFFSSV